MFLIRVHAGAYARHLCPVHAELPISPIERVLLVQKPGGRPRHVQLEPAKGGSRATWFVANLPAGRVQEFLLTLAPDRRRPSPRIRWDTTLADRPRALLDGHAAAAWELTGDSSPPGLSALMHPQRADEPVIRHLRIAPFLTPETIAMSRVARVWPPVAGAVWGRLTYQCHWLDHRGIKLADVRYTWTLFATPEARRMLDVEVRLTASTGTVRFVPTAENSILSIQLAEAAALFQGGPFTPPRLLFGKEDAAGALGVAEHAANPGHPCGWRRDEHGWLHARPFAGLSTLAPLLAKPRIELALGESAAWQFRLLLHAGDGTQRAITRMQHDLLSPPLVEVVPQH
jgi:hypothetical protein